MKYYAVRRGRRTGIFTKTSDYNAAVQGFSGAEARSFGSEQDAVAYLNADPPFHVNRMRTHSESEYAPTGGLPCAYTDGSFKEDEDICGYGIVVLEGTPDHGVQPREMCGFVRHTAFGTAGSSAAEIIAVLKAVEYAAARGFSSLRICTDSSAAIHWANYVSSSPLSEWYSRELNRLACGIKLRFEKVAGHKGLKYNERADELAREGANGTVRKILLSPVRQPSLTASDGEKAQLNVRIDSQLRNLLKSWCALNGLTQREAVEHLIASGCRQITLPDRVDGW